MTTLTHLRKKYMVMGSIEEHEKELNKEVKDLLYGITLLRADCTKASNIIICN